MKFRYIAVVAILAVLIPPILAGTQAKAGNVVFPACYSPQYSNTVYPGGNGYYGTYNYYSYYPGYAYQKVTASEIAVAPYIVTVPVDSRQVPIQNYGVGHYWSVQEAYQQKQLIRDAVREELRSMIGGGSQAPTLPTAPTQPSQPSNNKPPAAGKVTDLGVDNETPAEISQPLIASMNQNCFKCHGAVEGDLKGGLRLLYKDNAGALKLAKQTDDRKWRIFGEMSTGLMPPSAAQDATKAVPQNQQLAWYRWASGR